MLPPNLGRFAHGQYVGAGVVQSVPVPFQPAAVQLVGHPVLFVPLAEFMFTSAEMQPDTFYSFGLLALFLPLIVITPAGFDVSGPSNVAGRTYDWIAFA